MKRWGIRVAVVALAWYGVIFLLLPRLIDGGGDPVMPSLIRGSLQTHGSKVCNQHARLGDRHGSWALQQIEGLRGLGNRYFVASLPFEGSFPAAVVVYPQHRYIYCNNLVVRLAFWNWDTHTYPTFLLTRDGGFYRNDVTGFDSRRPPTDGTLQELGESHGWSFERRLSLTPPCN